MSRMVLNLALLLTPEVRPSWLFSSVSCEFCVSPIFLAGNAAPQALWSNGTVFFFEMLHFLVVCRCHYALLNSPGQLHRSLGCSLGSFSSLVNPQPWPPKSWRLAAYHLTHTCTIFQCAIPLNFMSTKFLKNSHEYTWTWGIFKEPMELCIIFFNLYFSKNHLN